MGSLDKKLRVSFAIVLAFLYFTDTLKGIFAILALVIAILLVLTSFISFCPIYTLFGLNTTNKD